MALDPAKIAAKYARVTPQRSEDFKEGVKNPKKDWATETKKAESNYKTGVTKAANEGRFGKGVTKAGTSKWQEQTLAKGIDRWGSGVAIAENAYAEGIAPVLRVIDSTQLPQRYPKGDPRNIDRVRVLASALHKLKTG